MNAASRTLSVCKKVWLQLAIWIGYASLALAQYAGIISSTTAIIESLLEQLATNRLPWVMLSSFTENIVGASLYFPGSIIVLTGMAQTTGSPWDGIVTYFAIYLPAVVAQHVNFLIGRFTPRTSTKEWTAKQTWSACVATFWHPQLAAVTCYTLGNAPLQYRTFLPPFLCSSLAWSIYWALVIYNFGGKLATPQIFHWLILVYLLIWTIRSVVVALRSDSK
jgi:membrane protein DedA with SNARE-associated domain